MQDGGQRTKNRGHASKDGDSGESREDRRRKNRTEGVALRTEDNSVPCSSSITNRSS